MELTKKQIKAIIRRFTYFDSRLNLLEYKVNTILPSQLKRVRRFEKELSIVTHLFQVHTYNQLPVTYDILENPKQTITKSEYLRLMSSEECKEQGYISKGAFRIIYISEGYFKLFQQVFKEMT